MPSQTSYSHSIQNLLQHHMLISHPSTSDTNLLSFNYVQPHLSCNAKGSGNNHPTLLPHRPKAESSPVPPPKASSNQAHLFLISAITSRLAGCKKPRILTASPSKQASMHTTPAPPQTASAECFFGGPNATQTPHLPDTHGPKRAKKNATKQRKKNLQVRTKGAAN
ncbi:hypothetical protein BS50DRAFT_573252 [Corynespora cassiicola Philippines]|uniref:Uncharacterized protein n=1 Tax=Corynespora cassiicola Philippines TaxID=1448308 RepID=A0A2T2NSF2_CORCC|nr:hypothetical protein BS50DRAFT_573252 [Corynespora cassiicola Philippines]